MAALDRTFLILGKVSILPVFTVVHNDGTGDAFHRSADIAAI